MDHPIVNKIIDTIVEVLFRPMGIIISLACSLGIILMLLKYI